MLGLKTLNLSFPTDREPKFCWGWKHGNFRLTCIIIKIYGQSPHISCNCGFVFSTSECGMIINTLLNENDELDVLTSYYKLKDYN